MKIIPLHQPPIKIKINLENSPLSIWRKVLVPADINLLQLHFIIQDAMGWELAHMFQFQNKRYQPDFIADMPDEFDEEDDFFSLGSRRPQRQAADELYLADIAEDYKSILYWYDFGDDWWHQLSFQKVTKKDMTIYGGIPVCTDATGQCPPEDCGGVWGYNELLEIISNPKDDRYQECREWMGLKPRERYNPEHVDIPAINQDLELLIDSPEWNMKTDE